MDTPQNSNEDLGFSPKMALCLSAISLVGIDGEFKEDELDKLRMLVKSDETSFLKAFNFYNLHPLEMCIKVVSAKLNDEQKRVTYKILYKLAKADREMAEPERQLLSRYASAFNLTEDYVELVKKSASNDFDISVFS